MSRGQTASAVLVSMALAAGCGRYVTVERPALFDMAAYKTIAVEDAPGGDAARMSLAIRKVVRETRFDLGSMDEAAMDSVAIIKFFVTENSYFEETTSEMKEKKGDTWLETTRMGTFEFAVTIRAIDGKTDEEIFEESFFASKQTSRRATGTKSPASISRGRLAGQCVEKVAKDFAKLIAPYKERTWVPSGESGGTSQQK